jgi:hypothetical protein
MDQVVDIDNFEAASAVANGSCDLQSMGDQRDCVALDGQRLRQDILRQA